MTKDALVGIHREYDMAMANLPFGKNSTCPMKTTRLDAAFQPRRGSAEHPLAWLIEPLLGEPSLEFRAWFGRRKVSPEGRHRIVLTTQGERWQGVLVCTSQEHHPSLRADLPALVPHPVHGK